MAVVRRVVRRPAGQPGAGGKPKKKTFAQIVKEEFLNPEPWIYYDTLIISAGVVPPASAAFNFASFVSSPIPFFSTRNRGNSGASVCNAADVNKFEADFLAKWLAIDVYCPTDASRTAAKATAPAFVETITMFGAVELTFGPTTKFLVPISSFPAGGGPVSATKIRTQAAAADSDSGSSNNGLQTPQALKMLDEPIMFERGEQFTCMLHIDAAPAANSSLAELAALTALSGTQRAMIRIKWGGVRGTRLLQGTPTR